MTSFEEAYRQPKEEAAVGPESLLVVQMEEGIVKLPLAEATTKLR